MAGRPLLYARAQPFERRLSDDLARCSPGPNLPVSGAQHVQRVRYYGDLTYHLTPRLSLTGGVRIAHNTQTYEQTTYGTLAGPTRTISAPSSDTSKTYMFTARYALTANSNAYVRIASGYRPGGPNALLIDPSACAQRQPDLRARHAVELRGGLQGRPARQAAVAGNVGLRHRWKNIQQLGTVDGVKPGHQRRQRAHQGPEVFRHVPPHPALELQREPVAHRRQPDERQR